MNNVAIRKRISKTRALSGSVRLEIVQASNARHNTPQAERKKWVTRVGVMNFTARIHVFVNRRTQCSFYLRSRPAKLYVCAATRRLDYVESLRKQPILHLFEIFHVEPESICEFLRYQPLSIVLA